MNLAELAALAGVSVSTVSKALADSHEISEQTKSMIIDLARKHGCLEKYYKPKYPAKVIAVICPEILGNHYGRMAMYMEKEIAGYNGTMVLSVTDFSPKRQEELIEYYIKYAHADGIVVIEPAAKIKNYSNIQIVQIGPENESKGVDCIKASVQSGVDDAIKHLCGLGHKRIAYIGENKSLPENEAFLEGMNKRGLAVEKEYYVIGEKRFEEAGYTAMESLLRMEEPPTAVFAAYSHIAIGMMEAVKDAGLSVPNDVSVICMDDVLADTYTNAKLAHIKMHMEELSVTAIDFLYRKILKGGVRTKLSVNINRQFYEGETVAPPKQR
ncbi:MAG: LacI family DNA-binding transcriptional regulator [Clostridia bacterium]|nr:LacI family DNA-binding transcriptional regulator [Clostridia bacterium]